MKILNLVLLLIVINILGCQATAQLSAEREPEIPSHTLPQAKIQYQTYDLPHSLIHAITIPSTASYKVRVALASNLENIETLAQKEGAIAAINGGFFDPNNGKTTSYIIQDGIVTANPRENEGLVNNPNLSIYLKQIFNRSEWRSYICGEKIQYAIAFRSAPIPQGCKLEYALGGGPQIIPEITAEREAFWARSEGKVIRDPLAITSRNARSAVGITAKGDLVFVMAEQKSGVKMSGMSLMELAEFMKTLDVKEALNLDGGSSSSLYYQGKSYYGKLDQDRNSVKRPIKSILLVRQN